MPGGQSTEPQLEKRMCSPERSNVQSASSSTSEVVTLTFSELENLIESVVPSVQDVLASLSQAREADAFGACVETCSPCVKGLKVCVRCCLFKGCKTTVRPC